MDTPERARIEAPPPNFEESPFSSFLNNLSPIEPSKTVHTSQMFGTLSFTSPPSVFTSPHINPQRESRFLRRKQLTELGEPGSSSDNANKDSVRRDAGNPGGLPSNAANVGEGVEPSVDEGSVGAPCETFVELPRELKYNHGSPDFQTGCETKNELEASCVSCGEGPSSHDTNNNEEVSGREWENFISDCTDLVVFESPQDPGLVNNSQEQSVDEHVHPFVPLFSHIPEGVVNELDQQQGLLSSDVLLQINDQPDQANQLNENYHGRDNIGSSSLNGSLMGQGSEKSENEPNLQRGVRRRCLVFEIPGSKKNGDGGTASTSSSSREKATILSNAKQPVIRKESGLPKCMNLSIGLHLNTVSVSSTDRNVPNPEALSSETQLIPVPRPSESPSLISSADLGMAETEVQVAEDASQAPAYGAAEDLKRSSPKKKRRRPENGEEGECKRCNCKKSKCLKLYCECFAAGVYCSGPCACQDCFNKPVHEDTVLATRKQIESRNPLAFAPKVIKSSDSGNDLGDEPNRTPASARHKRGCNCKKSNCLKKYCECYQGGVGCSVGCRCEGCKNTFGRKDGTVAVGTDIETELDAPVLENSLGDSSGLGGRKSTFLRTQHKPGKLSIKTLSPNSKRVSPPNRGGHSPGHRSSRKLILQSIPSFPSLTPRR